MNNVLFGDDNFGYYETIARSESCNMTPYESPEGGHITTTV